MKKILGGSLIRLCAVVDHIPWRDHGKWYLFGYRGCCWGIADRGFELMGEKE